MTVGAREVARFRALHWRLEGRLVAVHRSLLERRGLFLGQKLLVGELLRALHRGDAAVVKEAPEVGVTPGRARHLRSRDQRCEGHRNGARRHRQEVSSNRLHSSDPHVAISRAHR